MLDSPRCLAAAVIAFALVAGAAGGAHARAVNVPVATYGPTAEPRVLAVGIYKKRFGHRRFHRHHHGKRFGFHRFGHRGFKHGCAGPRHRHGHVGKGWYFGGHGFVFRKRFGKHH